eukprot:scaffold482_cov266-Amphora_coffeaeformis.AAC.28
MLRDNRYVEIDASNTQQQQQQQQQQHQHDLLGHPLVEGKGCFLRKRQQPRRCLTQCRGIQIMTMPNGVCIGTRLVQGRMQDISRLEDASLLLLVCLVSRGGGGRRRRRRKHLIALQGHFE